MQAPLLKSLLNEGITEFGVTLTPVNGTVSKSYPQKITDLSRQCPSGLTRAVVVENGHKWEDKFTFGCGGDKVHSQMRTNGVLIQLPLEWVYESHKDAYSYKDMKPDKAKAALKRQLGKFAHTKITKIDGVDTVQMVVSRKAIIVPWNEYAMVVAEREREKQERDERQSRLTAAAAGLRGPIEDDSYLLGTSTKFNTRSVYKGNTSDIDDKDLKKYKETADYAVSFKRGSFRGPGTEYLFGRVEIPLTHAEKIGNFIAAIEEALNGKSYSDKGRVDLARKAYQEFIS